MTLPGHDHDLNSKHPSILSNMLLKIIKIQFLIHRLFSQHLILHNNDCRNLTQIGSHNK